MHADGLLGTPEYGLGYYSPSGHKMVSRDRDWRHVLGRGNQSVDWNPRLPILASCWSDTIQFWNTESGVKLEPKNQNTIARTLAWDPSGTRLAIGSSEDPSGTMLALGSPDHDVEIWELESEVSLPCRGHKGTVTSLAWSPDGQWIASASGDNSVRFWNRNGTQVEEFRIKGEHLDEVKEGIAWNPAGRELAIVSGSDIKILNPFSQGDRVDILPAENPLYTIDWHPNGKLSASGSNNGQITIWDVERRTELAQCEDSPSTILALAWHPSREILVSSSENFKGGVLQFWSPRNPEPIHTIPLSKAVWSIDWSPDGTYLATCSGVVEIWRIRELLDRD